MIIASFLDAITTVDVLTASNTDITLAETRTTILQKSSSCFERINKLDRNSRIEKKNYQFLPPEITRDIAFIQSILNEC